MGYNKELAGFVEKSIRDVLGEMDGKSMLELGNQEIENWRIPEKTGKEYFGKRGMRHVSIDLNGEDGALRYDLSRLIPTKDFPRRFDVVTNAGTSEHVEPLRGQYFCFKNIHNLLATGGIAVHIVPDVEELELHGAWKDHCQYYYSDEFFRMLANHNSYRLVSSTVIQGNRSVCLQRMADVPFMRDKRLFLSKIARRPGGIVYVDINDNRFMRPIRRLKNVFMRPIRRLNVYKTAAHIVNPLRDGIGPTQIKKVYWRIAAELTRAGPKS